MCEKERSAVDILSCHPRHPSLIHLKKYNVKERRKVFEKVKESLENNSGEHCLSARHSVPNRINSVKNKSMDPIRNKDSLCDENSNFISTDVSKPSISETVFKIENSSIIPKLNKTETSYVSAPIPIFTNRYSSHLRLENGKKVAADENYKYITDQPYKSKLISKVVWTGIPEAVQEKSDESESGVFLNDLDCISDENSNSPLKIMPTYQSISDEILEKCIIDSDDIYNKLTSSTSSTSKPILPPKPPRLLNQLSYSPSQDKVEKPPKRCSSSAYEYLTNSHSVNLLQNGIQNSHKTIQKCSTFPLKSPTSPPNERSPSEMPDFLKAKDNFTSTPQDLFLCKAIGVAEMKDKFERQSLCSETSSVNNSVFIKRSAEDQSNKKYFLKTPKSKKFVSRKLINNPNYEYVRVDDIIHSRTKSQASRVTFKESDTRDTDPRPKSRHEDRNSQIGLHPLSKKYGSVHDEHWSKNMLDCVEPTYAEPRVLSKRFVSQTNIAFDSAGYAIPCNECSLQLVEEDMDEDEADKSIYMRGFTKEERSYFKSKVSDAYSILRTGINLADDIPVSLLTRSVSAGNISRNGTSEQLDFLEQEKRLNYVSTIRRLTLKNVTKYEQVKWNLNVNLFEYALIVGLKQNETNQELIDGNLSSNSKSDILFSWPENLPDSDLMTSNFCFPDAQRWQNNSQLSEDMFCFYLTTCTGDRKFCWCLRFLSPESDHPEAICVVSKIGEAGFYQQLLNGVREARWHSLELAEETLKSAYQLKLPKPNQELYINSWDREGFKYTGVLKRMTESHCSMTKFGTLVRSLPISLLIQVVASVLLERRVILLAEKLSTLSSCIMSLSTLLYPFSWPHTLITVLPDSLLELVHSPTPYILGMFSSSWGLLEDSSLDEVLVVDLDDGYFVRYMGDESRILPKKIQKALTLALSDVPIENATRSNGITDVTLTEAFLRMFVEMCGHYKDFMSYSVSKGNTFQGEQFVKSVSSNSIRLFLEWFSRTQMFQVFMHDRMKESFNSDLFDQRIEEYKKEMEVINNPANMKFIRSKFVNFFKSYGTKLKKTLRKNTVV